MWDQSPETVQKLERLRPYLRLLARMELGQRLYWFSENRNFAFERVAKF
jgi:hypothetical protein